jgi:5-methylcytosine-specific restriction protein A
MVNHDDRKKSKTTASQYKSAVDAISRHYSGQIRKNIDLYTYTKIYIDTWVGSILHYTGMGANGDQSLDYRQNKILSESDKNGVRVLLFEQEEPKKYTFWGRVELAGKPYSKKQKGQNGKDRKVWKFPLKIVEEKYEY